MLLRHTFDILSCRLINRLISWFWMIISGMATSAIADLMGHADTRMVETVYARARKEGVIKHLDALEARNASF